MRGEAMLTRGEARAPRGDGSARPNGAPLHKFTQSVRQDVLLSTWIRTSSR